MNADPDPQPLLHESFDEFFSSFLKPLDLGRIQIRVAKSWISNTGEEWCVCVCVQGWQCGVCYEFTHKTKEHVFL